jgi:hypothetical protein
MSEIINLTQAFVDQKISEIAQNLTIPITQRFLMLNLRKKLVVYILNQLQPKYMLSDSSNINSTDMKNFCLSMNKSASNV